MLIVSMVSFIMFKQKSNKYIVNLQPQEQSSQIQKSINVKPSRQIVEEFQCWKRNPSISRKIEEKCKIKIGNLSRERSESLRSIRKRKQERQVHDEYRTNPTKRVSKKQELIPNKQDENSFQLKCNSRQNYNYIVPEQSRVRLKRIRSNDSFSKNQSDKMKQQQNKKTLTSLKETNTILKQTYTHSLKRISSLQEQKDQEKSKFQVEIAMYQRQMQAIRNKIDRNRVQIGHLFSYQTFDPFKINVKPIIEVEEHSSLMHSLYNTNQNKSEYGLFDKIRKNTTETTCIKSIEDYKDLQLP